MVDRQTMALALLPAALGVSNLAAAILASDPSGWPVAALQYVLAIVSAALVAVALRRPDFRLARMLQDTRWPLAVVAAVLGAQAVAVSGALARRLDAPGWLAIAALGILGVSLAVAHLALYRKDGAGPAPA